MHISDSRATTTVEASAPNPGATVALWSFTLQSPISLLFHGTYIWDTSVNLNTRALMNWTWIHISHDIPRAEEKRSEFPRCLYHQRPHQTPPLLQIATILGQWRWPSNLWEQWPQLVDLHGAALWGPNWNQGLPHPTQPLPLDHLLIIFSH